MLVHAPSLIFLNPQYMSAKANWKQYLLLNVCTDFIPICLKENCTRFHAKLLANCLLSLLKDK